MKTNLHDFTFRQGENKTKHNLYIEKERMSER